MPSQNTISGGLKMRLCIAMLCGMLACSYPAPVNYPAETTENSLTAIEIILPTREITAGDDIPARCVLLYADGTRREARDDLVRWECSDETVCAVQQNKLRAVGKGIATLQAYMESFADFKIISVTAPPDYKKILISEVYYDPAQLADAEFIELWNISSEDIDIGGCTVSEGGGLYSFAFPSPSVIGAYQKIVLPRNRDSFFQEFQYYPDFPSTGITHGNSGETVILKKPDGIIIDIVFLEGGDEKYPQPAEWCASKLPNAPKGYSASRISSENSTACTDWDIGRPTPGK